MNKFQWNFNQNIYILIQENTFENTVCKMTAILCMWYVKFRSHSYTLSLIGVLQYMGVCQSTDTLSLHLLTAKEADLESLKLSQYPLHLRRKKNFIFLMLSLRNKWNDSVG